MESRRMAVGGGFYRFCRMVSAINRLIRWAVTLLMVAALCFAFYEVGEASGRKEAKIRIIEKEVEVIKYVEKKRAEIQAKPNAGRDALLELMRTGCL